MSEALTSQRTSVRHECQRRICYVRPRRRALTERTRDDRGRASEGVLEEAERRKGRGSSTEQRASRGTRAIRPEQTEGGENSKARAQPPAGLALGALRRGGGREAEKERKSSLGRGRPKTSATRPQSTTKVKLSLDLFLAARPLARLQASKERGRKRRTGIMYWTTEMSVRRREKNEKPERKTRDAQELTSVRESREKERKQIEDYTPD